MKYRLFFLTTGFVCTPLWGGHLTLSQLSKFEFMERRLTMIESLLTAKKAELARLETQVDILHVPSDPVADKITHLRKDLSHLAQSLPVLKNSLYALRST